MKNSIKTSSRQSISSKSNRFVTGKQQPGNVSVKNTVNKCETCFAATCAMMVLINCMVEVFFVALQNVNLIRKEKAAGIWCLTLLWILMMCKVRMSREHLQSREVSLRPSLAPLRRQKVIKKKHMSIHRTLSSSSSKKKLRSVQRS